MKVLLEELRYSTPEMLGQGIGFGGTPGDFKHGKVNVCRVLGRSI